MFDRNRSWYHWHYDIALQRQENGAVTIAKLTPTTVLWEYTVPAAEWASIVAMYVSSW